MQCPMATLVYTQAMSSASLSSCLTPSFPYLLFLVHCLSMTCLVSYSPLILSSPLIPKSKWPTQYWGANYPRLLKIKEQYDPKHVFSNPQSVGSHLVSRKGVVSEVSSPVGQSSGTA